MKNNYFLYLGLLFLLINTHVLAQQSYSRVKIFVNQEQLSELAALGVDITEGEYRKNRSLETDLSQDVLARLVENNIDYQVLIPDVIEFYAQRAHNDLAYQIDISAPTDYPIPEHFELGSMAGYYTLDEVMAELDEMASLYPDLISTRVPISTDTLTHDGRMLYWVKISDNPNTNEDEPEMMYTALHHAREVISVQSLVYYMWYLLENYESDPDIAFLVDNTELYFVPVVNPDGYEYNHISYPAGGGMWRKNRNDNGDGTFGVDINRNYSYMWGFDDSGSSPNGYDETYRGSAPMSEPETRNMRQFCSEHEFQIALNYHSYSNLLLYPWGYQPIVTPDHELMTDFARLMTEENNYVYGPASTTIYPTNGDSNDWMYGDELTKDKIYAYVPEIGSSSDGFWPTTSKIIPLCQENVFQSLMAARLLLHYAEVINISPMAVPTLSGYAHFNLKRLGLKNGGVYTVSIAPLDAFIQMAGTSKVFTNMELLEIATDSIEFTLDPAIEEGTVFRYLLSVDNGQMVLSDTISRVFGTEIPIFNVDFEQDPLWLSQKWDITESEFVSPLKSMTDSPFGNYSNDEYSELFLDSLMNLTGANAAFLRFWAKWETEAGYDYVQVMASADTTLGWIPLSGKYTKPGTEDQAEGEPLYDGFQYTWVQEEINLADFLDQKVWFKFVLVSDTYVREDGFYFDDLSVSIVSPTTGNNEITDKEDYSLRVFPNPGSDHFRVNYQGVNEKDLQLGVFSISGKLLFKQRLQGFSGTVDLLDVPAEPGVYLVALMTENKILHTQKLVVY